MFIMGEGRNALKMLSGKQTIRLAYRWENNIRVDPNEWGLV